MESIFERVVAVLAQDLGDNMARASVKMVCERMKLVPETVNETDLPGMAEKLRPGLKIFVGATRADLLAARVGVLAKVSR